MNSSCVIICSLTVFNMLITSFSNQRQLYNLLLFFLSLDIFHFLWWVKANFISFWVQEIRIKTILMVWPVMLFFTLTFYSLQTIHFFTQFLQFSPSNTILWIQDLNLLLHIIFTERVWIFIQITHTLTSILLLSFFNMLIFRLDQYQNSLL